MSEKTEYTNLIKQAADLYKLGFFPGTSGNMSLRLENSILITPSGISKNCLHESDLVEIDFDGHQKRGHRRPSSEMLMHIYIYRCRPDIKACCHAHPPYVTALSVTDTELPAALLPETILALGPIAHVAYFPVGTDQAGSALEPFMADCQAFVLKNHGALTIGRTLEQSCLRMETFEHTAKIFYIAQKLGKLNFLEQEELVRLKKLIVK